MTTAGTWQDRAACLDADPELFYAPGDWDHAPARAAAAKTWCATCPVRTECLDDALRGDDKHGIRGGMTPTERDHHKRSARRRQPITHGTEKGFLQHKRRGERPCLPCADANSTARRTRDKQRKDAQVTT